MSNSSGNDDCESDISLWTWYKKGRSYRKPISSPLPSINVVDAPSTCLLPSQLPRDKPLIPGTMSFQNVQLARRRKQYHEGSSSYDPQNPIPTQMFYNDLLAEGDPDFNEVRWTSAVEYLTQKGQEWTPLNSIQCTNNNWAKIKKVLVMIENMNKNEFGDALVTLKDPTGTMGASIHMKVFENDDFKGLIKVGAVLLLKKVNVCKLNSNTMNLNIVVKNIVKVIGNNQMIHNMVDELGEDDPQANENLVDDEIMSTIVPDSEDELSK